MNKILLILIVCGSCLCLSSCAKKDVPTLEEYKAANQDDYSSYPAKTAEYLKKAEDERLEENWENEYGDLMYHADGSLRDPATGDGYTASQNYWIIAMIVIGVMCVWAGVGSGNPFFFIGSCLFCIIVALFVIFAW